MMKLHVFTRSKTANFQIYIYKYITLDETCNVYGIIPDSITLKPVHKIQKYLPQRLQLNIFVVRQRVLKYNVNPSSDMGPVGPVSVSEALNVIPRIEKNTP